MSTSSDYQDQQIGLEFRDGLVLGHTTAAGVWFAICSRRGPVAKIEVGTFRPARGPIRAGFVRIGAALEQASTALCRASP
jgi:hypothetical protein